MDKIELNTFPKNRVDALVMLYLSKQDISDLTPAELVDKYVKIHDDVSDHFRELKR